MNAETERMISNLIRVGVVAELDEANARVKMNVGGLVTDWLPWGTGRAGATSTWSAPRPGEQMLVFSPYGDTGQAVVMGSIPQDDHPAPATSRDQETTVYPDGATVDHNSGSNTTNITLNSGGTLNLVVGGSSIVMDDGKILLSSNGSTIELTAAGVAINGARVDLN